MLLENADRDSLHALRKNRAMLPVLVCVALCASNDVDQQLADKWIAERKRVLDTYPALITSLESRSPSMRREETLDNLRARLRQTRSGAIHVPYLNAPLSTGSIGILPRGEFKVIRRNGRSAALVGIRRWLTARESDLVTGGMMETPTDEILLQDFDVSKTIEGGRYKTKQCFIVAGNQPSTSSAGSKSVPVLRPFDTKAAEAIFRKAVEQEKAPLPRR
jgi:hypothetical protein